MSLIDLEPAKMDIEFLTIEQVVGHLTSRAAFVGVVILSVTDLDHRRHERFDVHTSVDIADTTRLLAEAMTQLEAVRDAE